MDNEDNNILEDMLNDPCLGPTDLPISLLRTITSKFSKDMEVGRGGFATVYKGQLQNGSMVAVKKLSETLDVEETKFNQEVDCLMRVKHKNIVRFLGYCAHTQGKYCKFKGKGVMAEKRQRFLCFEFLPGCLDRFISDESQGLEWKTRYNIIKGICDGLNYLHQQKIVHSDLKPPNILLDHYMVPKIADFGLSRCFLENQTRAITSNLIGTLGYMAPECFDGVITFKSDIYSLGIIIIEILTGHKGCPEIVDVLEKWRNIQGETWLQLIRVCTEIGKECINCNAKERPDITQIIERLGAAERAFGLIITDNNHCTSSAAQLADKLQSSVVVAAAPSWPQRRINAARGRGTDDKMRKPLDLYPPELRFPWEPNKQVKCPVTLTNRTSHYVAVRIIPSGKVPHSELRFPDHSLYETMEPHSTWAVGMTMAEKKHQPSRKCVLEVVMAFMGSRERLQELNSSSGGGLNMDSDECIKRVESMGGKVHRATLRVGFCNDHDGYPRTRRKGYIPVSESWKIRCIDVHPVETLILVGHEGGRTSISNFQTTEKLMPMQVTKSSDCNVLSAKFITGQPWFAVGDEDGWVHVHDAYPAWDKVKEFQAHDGKPVSSIAVHPTQPFLLTASSEDTCIRLWNWSLDWTCTRSFHGLGDASGVSHVTFNPWDTNTFASVPRSGGNIKVWKIWRSDATTIEEDAQVTSCWFYSDSGRHFLLTQPTGSYSTKIWDLQTHEHVHQLEMYGELVRDVAFHPTLPILATRTEKNHLCFWDTRTYRLEKILQIKNDDAIEGMVFASNTDFMARLLIPCKEGILIPHVNLPSYWSLMLQK